MDYMLGMAEALLTNVASTWLNAKYEHKLRFQALLFPKGVPVEKEIIRTATLGLPFNLISNFAGDEITLMTPK